MTSPPAKRRRSESSANHQQLPIQTSELSTLTLDQLKVQYGNVSVRIKKFCSFNEILRYRIGRSVEETSAYD